MNKTLRYSLLSMLMLVCGMISAQTTVTFNATTDKGDGLSITKDGITLTITGGTLSTGTNYRCYKSQTLTVSSTVGNITSVVFTCTANGTAQYGPGCYTVENGSYTYDGKVGTWTGEAASVDFKAENAQVRMTEVAVTYGGGSGVEKKDAGLAFSESYVNATMGQAVSVPTLTKSTNANCTFASSDETVATVDAQSGAVTLVAPGKTVITVQSEANDEYQAGKASYTLDVWATGDETVSNSFYEDFSKSHGLFTIDNAQLSEGLSYVWSYSSSYKCMKASAYVSGKNLASESWLVSPWITLSDAEVVNYLHFDQAVNKYFGNTAEEATLWIKEKGSDWKQLTITYPAIAEGKSFSDFETQEISLNGYTGKTFKIGFKYTSSTTSAGTWEIKNVSVSTNSVVGINDVKASDAKADGIIYNMAGQRMSKLQKGLNIVGGKKIMVK